MASKDDFTEERLRKAVEEKNEEVIEKFAKLYAADTVAKYFMTNREGAMDTVFFAIRTAIRHYQTIDLTKCNNVKSSLMHEMGRDIAQNYRKYERQS